VQIRPDIDMTSIGQQDLAQGIQGEPQMTIQDWQNIMSPELFRLTVDYILGDELTSNAQYKLDRMSNDMGFQYTDDLLQAFGQALHTQ